jgi:hypothetical protein
MAVADPTDNGVRSMTIDKKKFSRDEPARQWAYRIVYRRFRGEIAGIHDQINFLVDKIRVLEQRLNERREVAPKENGAVANSDGGSGKFENS